MLYQVVLCQIDHEYTLDLAHTHTQKLNGKCEIMKKGKLYILTFHLPEAWQSGRPPLVLLSPRT